MLIAHGPLAVISSYKLLQREIEKKSKTEKFLLLVFAFFIGILPDFDIFYLLAKNSSAYDHHKLITHTPIFWVTTGLILYIVTKSVFKKKSKDFTLLITKIYIISTLSHIFSDLLTGHINLLYPLYNKYLTLFGTLLPDNLFTGYIGNPIFGFEIVISLYFIYLITSLFIDQFKSLTKLFFILSIPYFIFNCYIYSQTYRIDTYLKDSNNHPIYDSDQDGLININDMDVDNNYIDNFSENKNDLVIQNIENIRNNTRILTKNSPNIYDYLQYAYGGMTIERLILQGYVNSNLSLNPLIWNYKIKNNIVNDKETLPLYLLSTNSFINSSAYQKKEYSNNLLFGPIIIIKKNSNYSYGILLNNNKVIFENDNKITEGDFENFNALNKNNEVFIQFYSKR